jgi:glutathione synthase/RimK-type ligase-like ATP-grasp enzyme
VTILILSTVADVHARAVMQALADIGEPAELVDLSEFPSQLALSLRYEGACRQFELRRKSGGSIDLAGVRAVWWRRPQPFTLPAEMRDEHHRRFAVSEAATAFHGLYQSLDAAWINRPECDAVAAHKPYQLTIAQQIGLEIPPTLMTNDPEAARAFWSEYEGEVIYKQFVALPETWRETRRLGQAEQDIAATIEATPVIFQRHIPAVADLRVIAIGDQLFAAGTDVRGASYPQDVRMNLDARYTPHELPEDVAERLRTLMRRLDLVYGAIDLRLTPDGRYVFLEINPAGQFLYIENDTGQKMAAALARALSQAACGAATPPPARPSIRSLHSTAA